MWRKYGNAKVDLVKIKGKYIPCAFHVEKEVFIIEEILSIRKGMVKCGTPGLRYFVKTQGKETELLFDNTEKSWTVIIHDLQVYGEADGPQRVLEELKYLN